MPTTPFGRRWAIDLPQAVKLRGTTRRRFSAVVFQLSAVTVVTNLAGVITGPLQARALGPSGRGAVAAVAATTGLLAALGVLGIGAFVNREVARGTDTGVVLGSLVPVVASMGVLVAVAGIPLAMVVSDGNPQVFALLLLSFGLLPFLLPASLLPSVAVGLSDWNPFLVSRLIPALGGLGISIVLYSTGHLTVTTTVVAGLALSVLSFLPLARFVRRRPLRFDASVARRGLSFGLAAGAGTTLIFVNQRLDQVVMASVTTARELGFYAVAVSITSVLVGVTASAAAVSLQPRIAAGETQLVGQATRVTIWIMSVIGVALAGSLPVLLPLLFGRDFQPSVPVAQLLLVASLPLAGLTVLGPALVASGRPWTTAMAEALALACGLPLLFVFLGRYGARAAAAASIVSYAVSFAYLLAKARATFGGSLRSFLVINRGDLGWIRDRARIRTFRSSR